MNRNFFEENGAPTDYPEDSSESEVLADYIIEDNSNTSLVNEAVKRVEQANLYMTLINHSLFSVGSARPEIIQLVQAEIREFIASRLNVLLGITQAKQESSFDEDEVEALKSLASRVLKRSTEAQPSQPRIVQVSSAPVSRQPAVRPPQPVKVKAAPQPQEQAAPQEQEEVSPDGEPRIQKRFVKKAVSARVKPKPMPSQNQMNASITAQAMARSANPSSDPMASIMSSLAKGFANMNAKLPEE